MSEAMTKPLFIPLKREFYKKFKDGTKTEELRLYGKRWNENTCRIGRGVTLSLGYGRKNRMSGKIWRFKKQHASLFGQTYQQSILNIYDSLDVYIACISITDLTDTTK